MILRLSSAFCLPVLCLCAWTFDISDAFALSPSVVPHALTQATVRSSTAAARRLARLQKNNTPSPGSVTEGNPLQKSMLVFLNAERQNVGLTPLTLEAHLDTSAQQYAEEMENGGFFSHVDPSGGHAIDRIRSSGYLRLACNCRWKYWTGENIAKGQQTISQVMKDWMDSPEHRENILDPHFTEVGIGHSGSVWVQDFGHLQRQ